MRKALLIALLITCVCFSAAQAAQVTLAWDASSPAPQGYRLYQRTQSGAYNYAMPVWSGATTMATIRNLADGTPYYFVARAFKGTDQSGNSNEVRFDGDSQTPSPMPTAAPSPTPSPSPPATPIPTPSPTPSLICVDAVAGQYQAGDFDVLVTVRPPASVYHGNEKSKTFHKTGCRYFDCADCTAIFETREEAIGEGYKPCGTCKP